MNRRASSGVQSISTWTFIVCSPLMMQDLGLAPRLASMMHSERLRQHDKG
jgi:hypothetical protein